MPYGPTGYAFRRNHAVDVDDTYLSDTHTGLGARGCTVHTQFGRPPVWRPLPTRPDGLRLMKGHSRQGRSARLIEGSKPVFYCSLRQATAIIISALEGKIWGSAQGQ